MLVIVKKPDNGVAVLAPSEECLKRHTLYEIAVKDVPEGLPFWIVDESEIPNDEFFFDAWEIPDDYREPDGYGSKFYTFEEIKNADN